MIRLPPALPCFLAALALAAAGLPGPALAEARGEVMAAHERFASARSYRIDIEQSSMDARFEYVAPDRFRVTTSMGSQIIVGNAMYVQAQGQTMRLPLPAGTLDEWQQQVQLAAPRNDIRVEALGADTVDGQSARKYRIHDPEQGHGPTLLWIGADGYPLRAEAGSPDGQVTLRYSGFNDASIRIDPPG